MMHIQVGSLLITKYRVIWMPCTHGHRCQPFHLPLISLSSVTLERRGMMKIATTRVKMILRLSTDHSPALGPVHGEHLWKVKVSSFDHTAMETFAKVMVGMLSNPIIEPNNFDFISTLEMRDDIFPTKSTESNSEEVRPLSQTACIQGIVNTGFPKEKAQVAYSLYPFSNKTVSNVINWALDNEALVEDEMRRITTLALDEIGITGRFYREKHDVKVDQECVYLYTLIFAHS